MKQVILAFFLIVGLNGTIEANKSSVYKIAKHRHTVRVIPVEVQTLPAVPKGKPSYWKLKQNIVKVTKKSPKLHNSSKVIKTAKKFLGVKYRYGGTTRKGIDCSAFVKQVFKDHKVSLPRTSRQQFKIGKKVSKSKARKGDLIFFSSKIRGSVGHVGIIIDPKKKLMIHASSGAKKVTISNYGKRYYTRHYKGIRRI